MELTDEQKRKIEIISGLGYPMKKIAYYLDVSPAILQREFENEESEFRYHYDRGAIMAEIDGEIGLLDKATQGSVTAVQILAKNMMDRNMKEFKDKLLNGHH